MYLNVFERKPKGAPVISGLAEMLSRFFCFGADRRGKHAVMT